MVEKSSNFVYSIFLLLWALRTIQYRPCVNIQGGIVANHFGRIGVSATVLVGALFLSSAAPVQARDRDNKCEKQVRKAEQNLRDAERHHGDPQQAGATTPTATGGSP